MLVTHRGLSGPSILQISSYWQPGDALRLDLLSTLDAEAFLREQRQSRPTAELKTVLSDQLPKRFAQRLCAAWLPNRPMRQYNERELNDIAAQLHHWPITASGPDGDRTAEVKPGGGDPAELWSGTSETHTGDRPVYTADVGR